jgi:hypothetical protein
MYWRSNLGFRGKVVGIEGLKGIKSNGHKVHDDYKIFILEEDPLRSKTLVNKPTLH